MSKVITTTFQLRRGSHSWYKTNNPVLAQGEPAYELDTNKLKIGDGTNNYNDLPYLTEDPKDNIIEVLAQEFSSETQYLTGDYVIFNNYLYRFITNHTGAWDADDVTTNINLTNELKKKYEKPISGIPTNDIADGAITMEKIEDGAIDDLQDNAINKTLTNVAEEFDESLAYSAGDYVIYDQGLYRFATNHVAGDPWDETETEATFVTIGDELKQLTPIEQTYTNVTTLAITSPASVHYELWISLTTASSGTINITFPTGTKCIGDVPTFSNSEQWEISVKDGVVVAGKVSE